MPSVCRIHLWSRCCKRPWLPFPWRRITGKRAVKTRGTMKRSASDQGPRPRLSVGEFLPRTLLPVFLLPHPAGQASTRSRWPHCPAAHPHLRISSEAAGKLPATPAPMAICPQPSGTVPHLPAPVAIRAERVQPRTGRVCCSRGIAEMAEALDHSTKVTGLLRQEGDHAFCTQAGRNRHDHGGAGPVPSSPHNLLR